jgi:hypothetical protein
MRKAYGRRLGLAPVLAIATVLAIGPAAAQGWWPWSNSQSDRPPVPEEPVYREAPPPAFGRPLEQPNPEPSPGAQAPAGNWSTKNPICLRLEQRLVQDGQRSAQNRLPAIEQELDQAERSFDQVEDELERSNCYEYFIFSKSVRRTRRCVDLAQQREQAKQRVGELESQRQQIASSSDRSYREDIIRELARNNCGGNYTQEARRYERNRGVSSIWQDEESSGAYDNSWGSYSGPQSGMTYRTMCVRLCDGYYFPVSFSTLPNHFEQDAEVCSSKCAAPAELYYYQNPGSSMDQSIALRTQEPYTSLKTAFRYRKQLVQGCSCKAAEYVPPEGSEEAKRAAAGATTGWEARSDVDAQQQQPN